MSSGHLAFTTGLEMDDGSLQSLMLWGKSFNGDAAVWRSNSGKKGLSNLCRFSYVRTSVCVTELRHNPSCHDGYKGCVSESVWNEPLLREDAPRMGINTLASSCVSILEEMDASDRHLPLHSSRHIFDSQPFLPCAYVFLLSIHAARKQRIRLAHYGQVPHEGGFTRGAVFSCGHVWGCLTMLAQQRPNRFQIFSTVTIRNELRIS